MLIGRIEQISADRLNSSNQHSRCLLIEKIRQTDYGKQMKSLRGDEILFKFQVSVHLGGVKEIRL